MSSFARSTTSLARFHVKPSFALAQTASTTTVWHLLLAAVGILAIGVYMYEVNAVAAKTFELRSLERSVERLNDSTEALEYRLTEMRSIQSLQARVEHLGYVAISRPQYLKDITVSKN